MKTTAIFCLLALCATTASAQTSGFYGGASIGQAKVDMDNSSDDSAKLATELGFTNISSSQDDSDTSWKIFAGYKLNQNLAIEGGYADLGKFQLNADGILNGVTGKLDGSVKSHAYFIDLLGVLPMGDFSVFGKLGGAYTQTKAEASASYSSASASDSVKENKFSPKLGVGVEYNITQSIAIRGEFERYFNVGDDSTTGESDVDVWSVGLKASF